MDSDSGVLREGSRLNQILLMRFEPEELEAPLREAAPDGLVAYSGLCTHAACGVSEWNADDAHLVCPCHASMFAPKRDAVVVGGPATRRLPRLPIAEQDDFVIVSGDFLATVGAP